MARPFVILMATAAAVAGLAACGGAPARPASVPADAAWGGEGKKGVFLKVGEHQGTLWQLEVWDRQGRVLGIGKFRLRGFAKARIIPEEVLAWENGALQLKDGTWLVPEPTAAP
ncbi:MAG: hypothetical protein HGB30_08300 [Holophagaceae bacterium]|nr:hypothetical protein [Holophagaceae bacterium]